MSEDFELNTVKYPPLKNVISLKWPPASLSWTLLSPPPPPPHRRFDTPSHLSTCIFTEVFLAQKKSWVTSRRKEKNESKIRKAQEMRLEQSAGQLLGNWTIDVAGQIFSSIEENNKVTQCWLCSETNKAFSSKPFTVAKGIFRTPFAKYLEQVAAVSRAQSTRSTSGINVVSCRWIGLSSSRNISRGK